MLTMMDETIEILCPFAFWAAAINSRDNYGRYTVGIWAPIKPGNFGKLGRDGSKSMILLRVRIIVFFFFLGSLGRILEILEI